MQNWLYRAGIVAAAVIVGPWVINWIAQFTDRLARSAASNAHRLLDPVLIHGSSSVEDVVKLALYLIGAILLLKFLIKGKLR